MRNSTSTRYAGEFQCDSNSQRSSSTGGTVVSVLPTEPLTRPQVSNPGIDPNTGISNRRFQLLQRSLISKLLHHLPVVIDYPPNLVPIQHLAPSPSLPLPKEPATLHNATPLRKSATIFRLLQRVERRILAGPPQAIFIQLPTQKLNQPAECVDR